MNNLPQIIDSFLENNPELWLFELAHWSTELKLQLALEDHFRALGIKFIEVEVCCDPLEICVKVYSNAEVDYFAITKEVIKGS